MYSSKSISSNIPIRSPSTSPSANTNVQYALVKSVKEILIKLASRANTQFNTPEAKAAESLLGLIYVICNIQYPKIRPILIEQFHKYLADYPKSVVTQNMLKLQSQQNDFVNSNNFSATVKHTMKKIASSLNYFSDEDKNTAIIKFTDICYNLLSIRDLKNILDIYGINSAVLKQADQYLLKMPDYLLMPQSIINKTPEYLNIDDIYTLKHVNKQFQNAEITKYDNMLNEICKKYKIPYKNLLIIILYYAGKATDILTMLKNSPQPDNKKKEIAILADVLHNGLIRESPYEKHGAPLYLNDLTALVVQNKITGFNNQETLFSLSKNTIYKLSYLQGLAHVENIDYKWVNKTLRSVSEDLLTLKKLPSYDPLIALKKFIACEIHSFDIASNIKHCKTKLAQAGAINIPEDNDIVTKDQVLDLFKNHSRDFDISSLNELFDLNKKFRFIDILGAISDVKSIIIKRKEYFTEDYCTNWSEKSIKNYNTTRIEAAVFLSKIFPEHSPQIQEYLQTLDIDYNPCNDYPLNHLPDLFAQFSKYIPTYSENMTEEITYKRNKYYSIMRHFYIDSFNFKYFRSIKYIFYNSLDTEDANTSILLKALYMSVKYINPVLQNEILEYINTHTIINLKDYNKAIVKCVIEPLHQSLEQEFKTRPSKEDMGIIIYSHTTS